MHLPAPQPYHYHYRKIESLAQEQKGILFNTVGAEAQ